MAISFKDLRSVRGLCAENPELTEGQVRWWIFRSDENGFGAAICRIGRRVLIDTAALNEWLESRRERCSTSGPGEGPAA